jgi:hypothetical protein
MLFFDYLSRNMQAINKNMASCAKLSPFDTHCEQEIVPRAYNLKIRSFKRMQLAMCMSLASCISIL